jgi:hypothetical protein
MYYNFKFANDISETLKTVEDEAAKFYRVIKKIFLKIKEFFIFFIYNVKNQQKKDAESLKFQENSTILSIIYQF